MKIIHPITALVILATFITACSSEPELSEDHKTIPNLSVQAEADETPIPTADISDGNLPSSTPDVQSNKPVKAHTASDASGAKTVIAVKPTQFKPKSKPKPDVLPAIHLQPVRVVREGLVEKQYFEFDVADDVNLNCINGTHIFVPAHSFAYADGSPVSGPVKVGVKEILTMVDAIMDNLQTISDGQIIQSHGMLYLDAQSGEDELQVVQGKSLQVEMPKMKNVSASSDYQMFNGGRVAPKAPINWKLRNRSPNELTYVTIPQDYLHYKAPGNIFFGKHQNGEDEFIQFNALTGGDTALRNPKYANTFVATTHFMERYKYIGFASTIICHVNEHRSQNVYNRKVFRDTTMLGFYLNNIDKDLWYCDSLAYEYVISYEQKIPALRDCYYGQDEQVDVIARMKAFYKQKMTGVYLLPQDIDFTRLDAREQLQEKGLSETEIDVALKAYARQQSVIKFMRQPDSDKGLAANLFETTGLGWINCDRYLNDPTAKPCKIMANVKNAAEFQSLSVLMVVNEDQVAINATEYAPNTYYYKGFNTSYMVLPVGKDVTFILVAQKAGEIYFAIEKTVIKEELDFEMKPYKGEVGEMERNLNRMM